MKLKELNLGGAEKRLVAPANTRRGGMLPRTPAAPGDAGISLITRRVVRKLNRKQAFLRLEELLLPWAFAACFVAMVAFFQWLDWPTGYPELH